MPTPVLLWAVALCSSQGDPDQLRCCWRRVAPTMGGQPSPGCETIGERGAGGHGRSHTLWATPVRCPQHPPAPNRQHHTAHGRTGAGETCMMTAETASVAWVGHGRAVRERRPIGFFRCGWGAVCGWAWRIAWRGVGMSDITAEPLTGMGNVGAGCRGCGVSGEWRWLLFKRR